MRRQHLVPAVLMACAASGYHAPRHPARLTMRRDAGGYLATRRHTRLAPRRAALSDDELAQRRKDRAEQAAAAAKAEKDEMKEEAQVEVYGYDDEDVNYWLDDDEDSMTFSTEKATLSGVGDAFGDLTVENVARDYRFPVSYIADVIASFGVQPPISDAARVRDLLDADQAFALLEAVTSLDASEVDDDYVSFGLAGCAKRLEAGLAEIFALRRDAAAADPVRRARELARLARRGRRRARALRGLRVQAPRRDGRAARPGRAGDAGLRPGGGPGELPGRHVE